MTRYLSLALVVLVSGCALTGRGLDPGPSGAESLGGQDATTGKATDYPLDLSELLLQAVHSDPSPTQVQPAGTTVRSEGTTAALPFAPARAPVPRTSLEQARKHFYDNCTTYDRCAVLRDRVQDRLVWASESACTDYLMRVRRSFTATNLNLGSATTLFGALGSVLTGTDATRVFSGAAAVTSGLRAEYNDTYFSSQAFDLVSKAIRNIRERGLKRLHDARSNKNIREYTVDAAVAEVVRYHASCNIMSGLEEAADAVARDRDPGLRRLSEVLQGAGSGLTLALGTAALDTSALPAPGNSCRVLSQLEADGTAASKAAVEGSDAASPGGADAAKAAAKHLAAISAAKKDADPDCAADGNVTKAEREMYESMRVFASLPIEEKAAGKARFDAARAQVLSIKAKIDQRVFQAQQELAALKKLGVAAKPT